MVSGQSYSVLGGKIEIRVLICDMKAVSKPKIITDCLQDAIQRENHYQ